ncbi:c-type cytochrome [Jiella sonneratiae]|uniref:Cytochrome c n=1 Tax=Jiella sonneratiae TaxID=2816856 RepID=A0ABS3IXK7_9HYPH|nr:cytochrome c [Jiella sonneratiae]MBO0902135.1 cytochrome c [Jiella sonneratiae]
MAAWHWTPTAATGTALALLAGLAGGDAAAWAQEASALAAGQQLVEANCSRCHAVARTGDSPNPRAPAFRTLSQRYPVAELEEALVEGISTGHPQMPEFAFDPTEAAAIIAYLKSIQQP